MLHKHQIRPRVEGLSSTSMVIVCRPKDMTKDDFYNDLLEKMARDLLTRYGFSIAIVGVEKPSDVAVLDDEAMRGYGWIRTDKVIEYIDSLLEGTIDEAKKQEIDRALARRARRMAEPGPSEEG